MRAAVVAVASQLLQEGGLPLVTIDAVSSRAGVSKPTIYRHWPNRTAIAIDAFTAHMAEQVPIADLGDARSDLTEQVRRVAAFYTTHAGVIVSQLVAATVFDEQARQQLRNHFFSDRFTQTSIIWQRALARGEVNPDVDAGTAIDILFGPIFFRLLVGHAPIDPNSAAILADAALTGLSSPHRPQSRPTNSRRRK